MGLYSYKRLMGLPLPHLHPVGMDGISEDHHVASSSPVPYSSPNVLQISTFSSGTPQIATYNTQDGQSGNVVLVGTVNSGGGTFPQSNRASLEAM